MYMPKKHYLGNFLTNILGKKQKLFLSRLKSCDTNIKKDNSYQLKLYLLISSVEEALQIVDTATLPQDLKKLEQVCKPMLIVAKKIREKAQEYLVLADTLKESSITRAKGLVSIVLNREKKKRKKNSKGIGMFDRFNCSF